MRIAIVGAGGVGGYYGALLARAGHDVSFLARGDHLRAIRDNGLRIMDHGESWVVRVKASDRYEELPGAALAIVAVKSYSLPEVSEAVVALARAGAVVLPFLNGVDAAERLERAGVPATSILGGSTFVSASRTASGVITRHSTDERIVVGELNGHMSSRVTAIAEVLRSTGVNAVATDTITVELWQKFTFIGAISAACGMARSPIGPLRDTPMGHLLLERAVTEIANVARARGVEIPADQEARTLQFIDALPPALTPSFLLDVQRGGPTELDILSGTVSRLGRTLGVPTPIHDTATAVLPG